jgi:2-oxo-3-hexenedioate decarboxylase
MEKLEIRKWAEYLDQAMRDAREVDRITSTQPKLSLADAYRIQDEGVRLREARGEKVIGLKMGLTSQAKREQMGLHSPVYGVLTDAMQVANRGAFRLQGKIHPKIEPEVAFIVARELRGRVTADQALAACSGVCAAMEILDSRFLNFKYFSLEDVVADNSSSAYFVLGDAVPLKPGMKLDALEMAMSVNGQIVQSALSNAISGDPVQSLVQLCELLDSRGLFLKAGSIVLAGAATQAVQLAKGQEIRLTVTGLAPVELKAD